MVYLNLLNLIFALFTIQIFQSSFGWRNEASFGGAPEKQFESSWPQILNTKNSKLIILQPIIQLQPSKEQQEEQQKQQEFDYYDAVKNDDRKQREMLFLQQQQEAQRILLAQQRMKKLPSVQINSDTYDDSAPQIQAEVTIKPATIISTDKDNAPSIIDGETSSLPKTVVIGKSSEPEPFFVDITAPQNSTEPILEAQETGKTEAPEMEKIETNPTQTDSIVIDKSSEKTEDIRMATETPVEDENISTPISETTETPEKIATETPEKSSEIKENLKHISKTKPDEMLMPIFLAPRWPRL